MDCLNCHEYKCVSFDRGLGVCKDPECIFIHNRENPLICAVCNATLHPDIIHVYCGSAITLKTLYPEMGDISVNGLQ